MAKEINLAIRLLLLTNNVRQKVKWFAPNIYTFVHIKLTCLLCGWKTDP